MKFPKWYNTDNYFGYIFLAGVFNPDFYDKSIWSWKHTVFVISIQVLFWVSFFRMF